MKGVGGPGVGLGGRVRFPRDAPIQPSFTPLLAVSPTQHPSVSWNCHTQQAYGPNMQQLFAPAESQLNRTTPSVSSLAGDVHIQRSNCSCLTLGGRGTLRFLEACKTRIVLISLSTRCIAMTSDITDSPRSSTPLAFTGKVPLTSEQFGVGGGVVGGNVGCKGIMSDDED